MTCFGDSNDPFFSFSGSYRIGFGTFGILSPSPFLSAIEQGYRNFDMASAYGNHNILGSVFKESGIERKFLFLASKVSSQNAEGYSISHFKEMLFSSTRRILTSLQTSYLDLLYLHGPDLLLPECFDGLSEMQKMGMIKRIGLCNITQTQLMRILDLGFSIDAIQIETNPFFWDRELIDFCHRKGLFVFGYRPLGAAKTGILENSVILEISRKYGCSPGSIVLGWLVAKKIVPLPKSENKARQRQNFHALHLELDRKDLKKIDALNTVSKPSCHWEKYINPSLRSISREWLKE